VSLGHTGSINLLLSNALVTSQQYCSNNVPLFNTILSFKLLAPVLHSIGFTVQLSQVKSRVAHWHLELDIVENIHD
jgi:hypothetical protein